MADFKEALKKNEAVVRKVAGLREEFPSAQEGGHVIPDVIRKEDISKNSLDVMETFGIEAPTLLNDYACAVEDAYIQVVENLQIVGEAYKRASAELQDLRAFKSQTMVSLGLPDPYPPKPEGSPEAEADSQ